MNPPIATVLNGPNLNLLGRREPGVYGTQTLDDIEHRCARDCAELGFALEFHQSNHEGELVDLVQQACGRSVGLVLNAAGFTHTSVALRDAVLASGLPMIEVHLSNVHAREDFRRHSYLSEVAAGVIVGCGPSGYSFALRRLAELTLDPPPQAPAVNPPQAPAANPAEAPVVG